MRTSIPSLLPIFRSEMQVRLLALVILQPERAWTLGELAEVLDAPQSSVHRELERALDAGVVHRDDTARPHRFTAATEDAAYASLSDLLQRTAGIEGQLRLVLERPDVLAAAIYGSWASGARRPDSDVDVLVIGNAALRELRRLVRPLEKATGRHIDLTLMSPTEFREGRHSSFALKLTESPTIPVIGNLTELSAV